MYIINILIADHSKVWDQFYITNLKNIDYLIQ